MAEKLKLEIEQRASFRRRLVWKGSNGKPINLSNWTALLQVRKTYDNETVIIELSTANGRIVLGELTGTIDLIITYEDTALLVPDTYEYDLLLSAPDGSKDRLVEGKFVVTPGVSRG